MAIFKKFQKWHDHGTAMTNESVSSVKNAGSANKSGPPPFGIVGKLWIVVTGIISALWALRHDYRGHDNEPEIVNLLDEIQAICKSLNMTGTATEKKLAELKVLIRPMPEKTAKEALEKVLGIMATSRSPSSNVDFESTSGGVEINPQIRMAAWDLQSLTINLIKESNGKVHAESAIAVVAGLAGAFILIQHHETDLPSLKPGSPILRDQVNIAGTGLMDFIFKSVEKAGMKAQVIKEIPEVHQPHVSHEKISIELVPFATKVNQRHSLSRGQVPVAAALATVLLIEQVKTVLDPAVSNAIAVKYLAFCSKTVPGAAQIVAQSTR